MSESFRLTFLFLSILCGSFAYSQDTWKNKPYEATLPLYDGERSLGEVKAMIEGETVQWIDRDSLIQALAPHLSSDTLAQLQKLEPTINLASMPLPMRFNVSELRLDMTLKMEQRSRDKLNLQEDYQTRYEGQAIRPAPFGGAINYRLEQNWAAQQNNYKYFSGQFDTFLNMNSVVLESQSYYQSNNDQKWFRGDTRLVKDWEKKQIRFQIGDIYPQVQGFMSPRPMGGLNISRNFALNPYRLPYPTGNQNFTLNARSQVKYFVNGSLIRSEYLPAGNYTAKDIPLNNGLNIITIEATDDLGQKKIFVFKSSASINLLNAGESRFDVSYGTPFFDTNLKREYRASDGKFLSSFYQYGFSSAFSASVYGQNQLNYNLLGNELIQATPIGNFSMGHAESNDGSMQGSANSASYQLIGQGREWFRSHTLGLRYENRSPQFKTSLLDISPVVQNNYSANYTLPLASLLTVSLGGNYGDVRNNALNDRYGIDTTLNVRLFNHHNLSFFVSRNRNEFKQWNDVAYVFLTIAFPNSNDFVSTFYDQKQKSTKLTYIKDNQNRLFRPKAQTILENNSNLQSGEVDVLVPTPFADLGGRIHADHLLNNDTVLGRGSLRMNSALVFAFQDNEFAMGASRPISSSFVLFKPEKRLRDQKIALKSTSPFTEAQTGLFGEISFSNLLAYQYREIQLDPTMMDEGRTLKKERFVVYPTYRSAHLIKLEEKGAVMLKGYLTKANGEPWALQVGNLNGGKMFFTNREGEFYIEGVEPGHYKLGLDGIDQKLMIDIPKDARGSKDIGTLILEEEEE